MKMRHPALRVALWTAAIVCAAVALIDLALAPLYVRGHAQAVLSHLNGLSALLSLPGLLLAMFTGVRQGHHTGPGAWAFILVANFFFYLLGVRAALAAGATAAAAWRRRRRRRGGAT